MSEIQFNVGEVWLAHKESLIYRLSAIVTGKPDMVFDLWQEQRKKIGAQYGFGEAKLWRATLDGQVCKLSLEAVTGSNNSFPEGFRDVIIWLLGISQFNT